MAPKAEASCSESSGTDDSVELLKKKVHEDTDDSLMPVMSLATSSGSGLSSPQDSDLSDNDPTAESSVIGLSTEGEPEAEEADNEDEQPQARRRRVAAPGPRMPAGTWTVWDG